MTYYTVYKEDEIIVFGNANECTENMGFKSKAQFHSFVSRVKAGIRPHYYVVVEDLDKEDEEPSPL